MKKVPMRCVVGVDLGGTNVRAQAFFENGDPAGQRFEHPSFAQQGTERILESVALVVRQAVASSSVAPEAVGLAIPGHVNDNEGQVKWSPNFGENVDGVFRYWKDVPIKEPLKRMIDLPIVMANDANAAAFGEYVFGSGKNSAHCLCMITLGTGVGGGVVLGPQSVLGHASGPLLLLGGNQGGGELGHIIVERGGLDCSAGTYGAVEAYCQRDAIVRRAQHRLRRGRVSLIHDLVEGDYSKITPAVISEAARHNDAVALEIWRELGGVLGTLVASMINVFAPDIFAIGGQVSKAGMWFLPSLMEQAENSAIPSLFRDCRVTVAEQVEDAGMLGGAGLALLMTS